MRDAFVSTLHTLIKQQKKKTTKRNQVICALHGTKPCEHKHGISSLGNDEAFSSEDEPVIAELQDDSGSDISGYESMDDLKCNEQSAITNTRDIPVHVWGRVNDVPTKWKEYDNNDSKKTFCGWKRIQFFFCFFVCVNKCCFIFIYLFFFLQKKRTHTRKKLTQKGINCSIVSHVNSCANMPKKKSQSLYTHLYLVLKL